ncbi:uncharacterized protein LOC122402175 [Colletes gigas]|uniref:uncharacterized protein LOC122402175 n=1 Tax=Colletes gigas TaxID=935657 RepID=UPI001C9AEBEB|nr:uncharacterized protein LOC122402175 [Colletes gigas]
MAQISNSTVFTNDASSTGASDLLQQAFQQVVDDDDHDNEFVAFLQNDDNDSETIHLTPEQAAALGLTFEVNSNEEVMYQHDQDNATLHTQENISTKNNISIDHQNSLSPQNSITIDQLNYHPEEVQKCNDNDLIKTECIDFQEWHLQKVSEHEQLQNHVVENDLSLEEINLNNQNHNSQQIIQHQNNLIQQNSGTQTIILEQTKVHAIKADVAHVKNIHENDLQYTIDNSIAQNLNTVPNSQAQILQKLPVILPSSQFIIKPAQTILKPTKNIRLLQGSSRLTNATVSPIHSIHSLNTSSNPNSVLLSKAAILNNLSSQIIKATPITAQLLNTSGMSAQLLNTSQILTSACEIQNQSVNAAHITNAIVNTTSGATQNLVTSQIRLSPIVKTSQPLQRGNIQQFLTPVLKGASNVVSKSNQILTNTSVAAAIPAQLLKSVQIPSQLLKTKATIGRKTIPTTGIPKTTISSNSPVVVRTTSIIKTQDLKAATSSTSILKPTQMSSMPISILKPQAKIAFNNSTKQSVTIAAQNVSNILHNSQKTLVTQQNSTVDCAKSVQNETIKQKLNLVVNGTNLKAHKKTRSAPVKSTALINESTDASKPLGSSENPIQIVQQGQTFHSMQRLTPTQLKQIAHVLQQRSQEAAASNEKVVYRVVFPEELDLRLRNPGNLLKNRGGKRGRPKKSAIRPSLLPPKPPPIPDEEQEELKDERKKVVARTRSGRLSRPPRHMVRDYKHLHHLDFLQPDLDDSDGGYSDYNTNNDKLEEEESPKELLTGLEVPKRKISDHFRCPTCNKIYLGRTRMARHFEMHPDHGSPEQLPPPTPEPELKQSTGQDPLKRKGKKRGPWAYVTPEAKSERRQIKLREAISVCEDLEIIKIAAKPVLNAQSLFDLLVLKSENNVRNFLDELKKLMGKIREKAGNILTIANNNEESNKDLIDISEESLCDALGLNPGVYRINSDALKKVETPACSTYDTGEPPFKLQKTDHSEDTKENLEERMSSGFSESSDLSVSDFLTDRRTDPVTNPTCPEVLSALTLMRKNPSPSNNTENNKSNNVSKLLISNPEIQSQISDNPGFQKVNINSPKVSSYQNTEPHKERFAKLGNSLRSSNFCKVDDNYDQSKLEHIEQAFIKLEPTEQGFVKLENGAMGTYPKQDTPNFEKMQNGLSNLENGSQNFAKGFQKLVSKIIPMTSSDISCAKTQSAPLDTGSCKIMPATSGCKISDSIPILQDTVPIISNNCDTSIFGSAENLDMSKIAHYDHIAHLDILNTSGVIDKNLLIDEKLVEQLHLVDQSNLVDELVSERLKNIMPDNILENNLIPNNSNLDTDLDFDALSEEFNRNTRS